MCPPASTLRFNLVNSSSLSTARGLKAQQIATELGLDRSQVVTALHGALGGAVTQDNAHAAHEAARAVPLDRLLVETDAPAIAVRRCPAEEIEPRHVAQVGESLAELRSLTQEEIARITTDNARGLFLAP